MTAVGLWTAAEWRRRWPMLVALAVMVAVAGGVATALAAGARRADTAFARFEVATGAPNLLAAMPLSPDLLTGGVPAEVIDDLAGIDGVEGVQTESWWAIALYPELDPPGVVTAFAIAPSATRGRIDEAIAVDGVAPGLDQPNAVTANEGAVTQLGIGVGSRMSFQTASPARLEEWASNDGVFGSADALDGPTIQVEIVAITRSDDDLGQEGFPVISFSEGFARAHAAEIAHVEPAFYLRVDPDRFDEIAGEVSTVLAPFGADVSPAPNLGDTIRPSIRVEVTTLWIAMAIAAGAGVLVIAQATGRQAASIDPDRRVLVALGMSRSQLDAGTVANLAPGVLAGALAVPLVAWSLSGWFPRGTARLAEPDPGLRLDLVAVGIGLVATALVVVTTVLVQSAVGRAPKVARPSRDRLAGWMLGRPALSLGASFAGDPAGVGRRSRTLAGATAAGIALGVGALVTVATMDASRDHLDQTPHLYGAPADLVYASNGSFGIAALADGALATPGVTALTRSVGINEDEMQATGPGGPANIEPQAFETDRGGALPPVAEGRLPQGPDEVALGAATAASLGVSIGDTVVVKTDDGGELALQVSGRVVSWADDDPEHAFVVQPDTLVALLCPGASLDDCRVENTLFASAETPAARSTLLDLGFEEISAPANVDRLREVGPIPWYLAGFLALLGAAGLLHGAVTTLRRRRRDLAIARALGLPARRAAAALTWQAAMTAIIGGAVGVVLGALAGRGCGGSSPAASASSSSRGSRSSRSPASSVRS
ncbi:MAG: ABC transporter permease [Ilumatobacteraceae bacterium]